MNQSISITRYARVLKNLSDEIEDFCLYETKKKKRVKIIQFLCCYASEIQVNLIDA